MPKVPQPTEVDALIARLKEGKPSANEAEVQANYVVLIAEIERLQAEFDREAEHAAEIAAGEDW